jgi:hypothetical protein
LWMPVGSIGYLVWDARQQVLSAHCTKHVDEPNNACRLRRTVKPAKRLPVLPGKSAAQGRPIGLLVAWLIDQERHESVRIIAPRGGGGNEQKHMIGLFKHVLIFYARSSRY